MKLKSVISVFLIFILSIQLLPVKQIVRWLLSGQATEEVVHAADESSKKSGCDESSKQFIAHQCSDDIRLFISSLRALHNKAEALTARLADDIPTPPPNS
jgi:hypothetical protein